MRLAAYTALFLVAACELPSIAFADPSPAPSPSTSPVSAASIAPDAEDPAVTVKAKRYLADAQSGTIDRSLLSERMNTALTPDVVAAVAARLGPLGTPSSFEFVSRKSMGPYEQFVYKLTWPTGTFNEIFVYDGFGKIAGLLFKPI